MQSQRIGLTAGWFVGGDGDGVVETDNGFQTHRGVAFAIEGFLHALNRLDDSGVGGDIGVEVVPRVSGQFEDRIGGVAVAAKKDPFVDWRVGEQIGDDGGPDCPGAVGGLGVAIFGGGCEIECGFGLRQEMTDEILSLIVGGVAAQGGVEAGGDRAQVGAVDPVGASQQIVGGVAGSPTEAFFEVGQLLVGPGADGVEAEVFDADRQDCNLSGGRVAGLFGRFFGRFACGGAGDEGDAVQEWFEIVVGAVGGTFGEQDQWTCGVDEGVDGEVEGFAIGGFAVEAECAHFA